MVKAIPANYEAASRLVAEGYWRLDIELGQVTGPSGKPYTVTDPGRYITLGLPLRDDMPRGRVMAHRVLWESVNGPLPADQVINHLDGDKQNNRPSNLEGVSQSGNMLHAFATGLKQPHPRGEGHFNVTLTADAAAEIYERWAAGAAQTALAREFGVGKNVVWRLVNGLTWSHVTGHNSAA